MNKITIFCDFDGTITTSDNIVSIMKKFAPPGWETIIEEILNQSISLKEGIGKLFTMIPSSLHDEMIAFLKENAEYRAGFQQFVDFTKENNIKLRVVSGGIDFFVYPMLEGLVPKEDIFCNGSDFSGETVKILWPHPCDSQCDNECGCCKPSIIRKLTDENDYKIVIGDSISDLQSALLADHVYACNDFLVEKCRENGLSFESFDTFFDVIESLQKKVNE